MQFSCCLLLALPLPVEAGEADCSSPQVDFIPFGMNFFLAILKQRIRDCDMSGVGPIIRDVKYSNRLALFALSVIL